MRDLITVVIPVYNAERYLDRCLESIINQTYYNLDILIINDGSTDGSMQIIRKYEQRDKRIRIIDKKNEGVSPTRNLGLKEALGKYIYFIDSDDYIDIDLVEKLYEKVESNSAQISICGFWNTFENYEEKVEMGMSKDEMLSRDDYLTKMSTGLYSVYYGALWNKLYDLEIIRKNNIKFPSEITIAEDFIFNLSYLEHITRVSVLSESKYHYYQDNNMSLTKEKDVWFLWKMAKIRYKYCIEQYKKMGAYVKCERNIMNALAYELISPTYYAVKEQYQGYKSAKQKLRNIYEDPLAREALRKMNRPQMVHRIAKISLRLGNYSVFVIAMKIWVVIQNIIRKRKV